MKKIVGILSAAAVLAAGAFALDISAMIQLDGNLATFGKDTVKAIELNEWDPQGTSDYVWKFDVAGDQAGATVFSYAPGDNHYVKSDNQNVQEWSLWFKPVDTIKVTVGNIYYGSAQPHFGWWAKVIDHADYGFQGDFDFGALKLTAGIGAAYTGLWGSGAYNTYWFDKDYVGLRKLGEFWVGASYNIDGIGTIGGSVNRGAKVNPHGFAQTQQWGATPLAFDLYYSNQPWGETGYFADFALVFKEKNPNHFESWWDQSWGATVDEDAELEIDRLTGQLYFEFHLDALTLYAIDVLEINFAEDADMDSDPKVFMDGFELKAQYALDSITPYVQIDGYHIMAADDDGNNLGVKLGVGFNVGTCAIDAGVKFDLGWEDDDLTCTAKIPVQFTVNF